MAEKGWVRLGGGVPCPACESDSKVVDTYWATRNNRLERRRECLSCALQFRTAETITEFKAEVRRFRK